MSVSVALVRFIYPARALGRGIGFNGLVDRGTGARRQRERDAFGRPPARPDGGAMLVAMTFSIVARGATLTCLSLAAATAFTATMISATMLKKKAL